MSSPQLRIPHSLNTLFGKRSSFTRYLLPLVVAWFRLASIFCRRTLCVLVRWFKTRATGLGIINRGMQPCPCAEGGSHSRDR